MIVGNDQPAGRRYIYREIPTVPHARCSGPVSGRKYPAGLADLIGAGVRKGRAALSTRTEMSDNGKRGEERPGTGVVVKAKPKAKKPSMYKVLILNDDYTPMEFVVHILERFFNKTRQEATRITLYVHQRGVGICGVYTYEVAETKVTQVMDFARQHQHPLQCTLEKD
jgi:ATP-dependent Clp protease adaptor protein ClpS